MYYAAYEKRSSFLPHPAKAGGNGDLAQLARASALQAEGQGFKSPNLQVKAIIEMQRDGKEVYMEI